MCLDTFAARCRGQHEGRGRNADARICSPRQTSSSAQIKAKEQEALAASKSTDEQGNGRLSGGSGVFGLKATGAAKNAARQSLEMASMRAKYKEGRRSVF